MPTLLFALSPALYPAKLRFSTRTTRRPRRPRAPVFSASSTPTPPADPSDPVWKDLARSLGSSDPTPPRPPPEWKQLDDTPSARSEEANAWANWKSARAAQDELEARDPKKETNFWRPAARELTQPSSQSNASKDVTDDATQTDIWGLARDVTGEVSELQDRLRADLDSFNPGENPDQYRRIARELIGPQEDDWEIKSEENVLERPEAGGWGGASAASGWNPDTDWKRFDDVRRDELLKKEKEAREVVARDAQQKRQEAYERLGHGAEEQSADDVMYTDESGRVLSSDEVKKAIEDGAVFVDEAGKEIEGQKERDAGVGMPEQNDGDGKFSTETGSFESGKVPGFIANRFSSRGTYGAAYAGAEEYVKELQEQGIPLRDPKADAESWREAARELNIDVGPEPLELTNSELETDEESDEESDESDEAVEAGQSDLKNTAEVVEQVDRGATAAAAASLWSSWRQGNLEWEREAASAAPRDPKQEIDMWRSSARDLASELEVNANVEDSPSSSPSTPESKGESSAWGAWRNASARWESTLEDADESLSQQDSTNPWSSQNVKADWGAGLDGKASSDRSAWENWNKVTGKKTDVGNNFWWSQTSSANSKTESNTEQWRKAASEVVQGLGVGGASGTEQNEVNSQSEAGSKDDTLNFWKDVAKEMGTMNGSQEQAGNPNEE